LYIFQYDNAALHTAEYSVKIMKSVQ